VIDCEMYCVSLNSSNPLPCCSKPANNSDSRAEICPRSSSSSSTSKQASYHSIASVLYIRPRHCIIYGSFRHTIIDSLSHNWRHAVPPHAPGVPTHHCERTNNLPRMPTTTSIQLHGLLKQWTTSTAYTKCFLPSRQTIPTTKDHIRPGKHVQTKGPARQQRSEL
jgi:hypothetical protein